MATKIYIRKGTDAERQVVILEEGEPGWTVDTKKLYVGDGVTSGGIFTGAGEVTVNGLVGAITISGINGIVIEVVGQTITVSGNSVSFIGLADTPDSYVGQAGKVPMVNEAEDGLEFNTISGTGGVTSLNSLNGDITISGVGGTVVEVNGQVITISGGSGAGEFTTLSDVPSSYSYKARQVVSVNAGETGLEFTKAIDIATLLDDHDYSGLVTSGIANQTLVFGNSAIINSSNKWAKTDADTLNLTDGHTALVLSSGNADENVALLLLGYTRDDDWSWTVGSAIFISPTAGELTMTIPTISGQFVRAIGYARASNTLWYDPDCTLIELG